jgi:hypothetical protein
MRSRSDVSRMDNDRTPGDEAKEWIDTEATPRTIPHSPFFLSSGLPFFTDAMTMSPAAAAGRRFRRAPKPTTEIT